LLARWDRLWEIRSEVTKALEAKRAAGVIGHSLDARVRVTAADADFALLDRLGRGELEAVFIVSQVELARDGRLGVDVLEPLGSKCARCWNYRETVGSSAEYPDLCSRCAAVVTAT
jgi:isoleucyl-tRNA synthetase